MTTRANSVTDRASGGRPPGLTQPARGVLGFTEAFRRLGYDVDDLLAAAGLSAADLADPDELLPCSAIPAIVARAQHQRPTRNLGLRLAAETTLGAFPLLDYLVLSSDTIAEAFGQLRRYLGLVGSPIAFEFHEDEDPVRVAMTCPGQIFVVEYTAALSLLHLRREAGGRLEIASVHFAHRPDDPSEFERVLRCPIVVADSWSGLAMPPASWRLPMRRRDPVLRAILERQATNSTPRAAPTPDTASRLRGFLASRISGGDTRIEAAARGLATAPRTLQRRLAAEGTSYQDVLEGLRREAAESYLAEGALSVGEVGYLLGYSEPAAFHRAFKRWHGVTPVEYRRSRRT
jgi:AraC-like DNA-binding protein